MEFILCTVFCCIAYWLIGFNALASRFFFFVFLCIVISAVGGAYNQLCVMVFPHPTGSFALAGFGLAFFMLFSGFFLQKYTIPVAWRWAYYLSFWNYGFQAAMENEFQGNKFLVIFFLFYFYLLLFFIIIL